jgi:hypothetical protein
MRNLVLALALLVAQGFSPVILFAQDEPPDPFKTARFRFGPLALNPTIAIRDVGIDGNVFNEWDNPKSDFTATVAPGTAFFLRLGRGRLTGNANVGYVFFKEYANERGVNTDTSVRAELPLIHVRPYLAFSYLNTRERPGYEIDARVRHFERTATAGVDLPLTARTTIGVSGRKAGISYASGSVFLGTSLRDVFDRDVEGVGASLQHKLTPLTALVLSADAERARFRFSPARDSDTVRITSGLDFSPFALVGGSARVGFRKLDMLGPGVPDYRGLVASADLGYTLLGATRFSVGVGRDVFYSFDVQQPYYLQTGLTLTATQHVAGPWDVQARWNGQRLEYRQVATAGNATGSGRTDRVTFYGGGIGYRLGQTTRLGLNLDAYRRRSPLTTREYRGLKVGSSLTYGF